MATIEVSEKDWQQFCERMQGLCRGSMVSIELVDFDGSERKVVENTPLNRIIWDNTSDRCNTNVVIETGLPETKPQRHVVVEPIHIRLKAEGGGDRYNRLQIIAENGTTILALQPGLDPAQLKTPAQTQVQPRV